LAANRGYASQPCRAHRPLALVEVPAAQIERHAREDERPAA